VERISLMRTERADAGTERIEATWTMRSLPRSRENVTSVLILRRWLHGWSWPARAWDWIVGIGCKANSALTARANALKMEARSFPS
jgi:hypothetical protein